MGTFRRNRSISEEQLRIAYQAGTKATTGKDGVMRTAHFCAKSALVVDLDLYFSASGFPANGVLPSGESIYRVVRYDGLLSFALHIALQLEGFVETDWDQDGDWDLVLQLSLDRSTLGLVDKYDYALVENLEKSRSQPSPKP